MADRYPLIVNAGLQQIQELAAGDNLDLSSSSISNVGNVTVSGSTNFTSFKESVIAGGNTGTSTLTPNASLGTIYSYTATGNFTLNALANAVAGTSMTVIVTQDATGGRTLTSTMKFAGASKTLSTAPNAIDVISIFFAGSVYYASLTKGYA